MSQIHVMALRHSAFYSPLLMAIAGGYLADEGLEPIYTVASPQNTVPDSIASGTCHVAQSAVATGFAALERGERPEIVHFAQINERDGFFLAGRHPAPNFVWSNLVGKKVLVDHFFQPMAMFRFALYREGVEYAALNVVDAGDVNAIEQAFRHGKADYVHMQGPVPQQLEKDGAGYVVAAVGEAVGPVAFSSLCASRSWLETDMARAFMRAYRRARQQVVQVPAEEIAAREAEAGFFPTIDRDVLTDTIAAYQKLGCWTPDPTITSGAYENLLDVFLYSGLISRRHNYDALVVTPPE